MNRRASLGVGLAALALLVVACIEFPDYDAYCENNPGPDCPVPNLGDAGGHDDAGSDAGSDEDGGAEDDAGVVEDAGDPDDAGHDAGGDAGADAGGDAGADAGGDAGTDAGSFDGGFWGTPEDSWFINVNSPTSNEVHPTMTADQLTLCFASDRGQMPNFYDLYCTTRSSPTVPFPTPTPQIDINNYNGLFNEYGPELRPDGQSLYYSGGRYGALGEMLSLSGPPTATGFPYGNQVGPDVGSTSSWESSPSLMWDAGIMYFGVRPSSGNVQLYEARVTSNGSVIGFGPVSQLNQSGTINGDPGISPDGKFLVFCSNRGLTDGGLTLFRAERFGDGGFIPPQPVNLPATGPQCGAFVSSTGDLLFHEQDPSAGNELRRAPRLP